METNPHLQDDTEHQEMLLRAYETKHTHGNSDVQEIRKKQYIVLIFLCLITLFASYMIFRNFNLEYEDSTSRPVFVPSSDPLSRTYLLAPEGNRNKPTFFYGDDGPP